VKITSVTYNGWSGAYRLSNGTVELVVVPQISRIMQYGYTGGPNLLWNNPEEVGKAPVPGAWANYGGDKAWPWPQYDWPKILGADWPPPPAADGKPFTARIANPSTLEIVSSPLDGFSVRIERDIHLADTGTRVTITTRFVRLDGGAPHTIGAWTITQIAPAPTVYAQLLPGSTLPDGWKKLGFDPFASVAAADGVLTVKRDPTHGSKIGIDGAALGAVLGDTLFTLRDVVSDAGGFTPGERVQVYSHEDPGGYTEMELTSPKILLARPGDTATLTTVWELSRLSPGDADPEKAFRQRLGQP
jgi:hypothetical protein